MQHALSLIAACLLVGISTLAGAQAPPGLQMQALPNGQRILLRNPYAGPIQIRLGSVGGLPAWSRPRLPLDRLLQAGESVVLAEIGPMLGRDAQLTLDWVPGPPDALPSAATYRFPLDNGDRIDLAQGFGGAQSHRDAANWHALDFATPEGTPVLAMRAGTVMQVVDGFDGGGWDARHAARANLIRILHDDGTMALYAHLRRHGARVRPGQAVAAGEPIGWSGNTGLSARPHLHVVVQVNRGMRLESIPVTLHDAAGNVLLRSSGARTSP